MTTVLIADDDTSINASLAERLRARGYTVVQAYSGRQALAAAEDHAPEIALLDVAMPEGDGLGLDFDDLLKDRVLIGSPDEVAESLLRIAEPTRAR